MDWISECCSASPLFSVDVLDEDEATGVCNSCREHSGFYKEDNDE
tara:strand:+ start:743 stop:877 length:135 start_codon:yes stop_codon:yes gene_type:complete